MRNMNRMLKNCGYLLCCMVSYIIVSYLLDWLIGNGTANRNWLEVTVSGVVFAAIMFLSKLYEEKKNNK